jgi:hypothetical protein
VNVNKRSSTALKSFLSLATAPVWFPLWLASGFQTWLLPSELWLRYAMFKRGLYVSLRQLRDYSRAAHGTIIYDWASCNLGYVRVWWTEEDVVAAAPVPPPPDDRFIDADEPFAWHEFDRWLSERYLDEEHGKARLVGIMGGRNDLSGLRARFPGCKLVCSFSGGRALEEIERDYFGPKPISLPDTAEES